MSANEGTVMNEYRDNVTTLPVSGRFQLGQAAYRAQSASPLREPPRWTAGDREVRVGSLFSQLCSSSREEIARLANIARDLRCSASIRSIDGAVEYVTPRKPTVLGPRETLAAPVYGTEGKPVAHIEVVLDGIDHPALASRLIRAVVEPLARAMSERWFRIAHCRYWIVAARQASDPSRCILLAMDRHFQLAAADHGARQMLKETGLEPIGLSLSKIFRFQPDALARARHLETALRLPGAGDGETWLVLITAPDLRAGHLGNAGLTSVHSRPRLEAIAASCVLLADPEERPGLPKYLVRRIEEFVGTRLEVGIDISELAGTIGYSLSHFFRMFRRSFGITPHAYVMRRRLAVAQELLTSTDLCLAEIALKAGFCDQSHLSRSFRRFSGLPPRAFRVQHRGAPDAESASARAG
jgi:AraC-like DNA-binding protein